MPADNSSEILQWTNISKVLKAKTKVNLKFREKELSKMKVKQRLFQTYKS